MKFKSKFYLLSLLCRLSLYKLFFSFPHTSLACCFNNAGLQVWVHTCHFALLAAGWVGPLIPHHLSCGLHHTFCRLTLVLVTSSHMLQGVSLPPYSIAHLCSECVAATLLYCPFMLRVCRCHPTLLPIYAQGVSLPPSFVAWPGCCCHPHTITDRVCHYHPTLLPIYAQGVSLPPSSFVALPGCCCHPHTITDRVCHYHPTLLPIYAQGVSLPPSSFVALPGCCCHPHTITDRVCHYHPTLLPIYAQGVSLPPSSFVALPGCCCHPHTITDRVCHYHPTLLPIYAQGVSLPPSSFVALPGCCCHPHTITDRVCCCHPHLSHGQDVAAIPIQSLTGCVTTTLLYCPFMLRVCRCHPAHLSHCQDVAAIPIQSLTGCVAATLICRMARMLLPSPYNH